MPREHTGSMVSELQAIVQRLGADVQQDGSTRSELLQIEITLRGMLPTLQGMLQHDIWDQGPSDGAEDASRGLITLTGDLEWIQLHAYAPLDQIRHRLQGSVTCAGLALQHLAA